MKRVIYYSVAVALPVAGFAFDLNFVQRASMDRAFWGLVILGTLEEVLQAVRAQK